MPAEATDGFDELFPGALQVAGEVFPGPPSDLVERGIVRGRRMRRARIVQVSAVTLSLALVVLGGVVAGSHVFGGVTAQTAASTPSQRPSTTTVPPASLGISDQWMIKTLEDLLPPGGAFTDATGRGTESNQVVGAGAPFASVVFHSAAGGASQVDVDLSRVAAGTDVTTTSYSSCPSSVENPYAVCTAQQEPDGSLLKQVKDFTRPQADTGQRLWSVVLVRTDGFVIEVSEYGAGAEKSTTSSVNPLLSTDQLAALARSAAWQPALASIKAPVGRMSSGPVLMTRGRVMSVLTGLLPRGVTVSDQSGQNGFAELVFDDGHGKTALEVNVQNAAGMSMNCGSYAGHSGTCSASTLPDGTDMVVTQGPSPKGSGAVTEWRVDTLRPNGLRVVVSEFNSASDSGAVTRATPGLSIAQLQQIATSSLWSQ